MIDFLKALLVLALTVFAVWNGVAVVRTIKKRIKDKKEKNKE